IEITTLAANPEEVLENAGTNAKFSAGTDLYLAAQTAHAPLAGLVDAWGFYRQQLSRLYSRYGVVPDFVRETTAKVDFWFAKARDHYRDAMLFTQEAERELERGQNLLEAELFEAAERAAARALRLNAGLAHPEFGRIRLLQALAIAGGLGADLDRDGELLEAARAAAELLAGDDERAAAIARVLIGDVHRRAGRPERALDVYDSGMRSLADGWDVRPEQLALRRAAAGMVVCLRALGRADEAGERLDALQDGLPEWNRAVLAWIRHDVGLAYQHLGREQEAMAEYVEAVRIAAAAERLEPHYAALLHAAELSAPRDPKAAMALLDDAVALLDRFIGAQLAEDTERMAQEARWAVQDGTEPDTGKPRPDPVNAAKRALAQATKIRLLIEPEPAAEDALEQLLPEAYQAAVEGTDALAALVRATSGDDPRRLELTARLETALGWVATVQGGMGDAAGAAARFTAFARLAEECGFPGHAATARQNARATAAEG
ncbi:MAG TPA: hypothetical protein VH372_19390, partial [Actinospica sp.]|nr:hypothetical protein [Actinospica sp.]